MDVQSWVVVVVVVVAAAAAVVSSAPAPLPLQLAADACRAKVYQRCFGLEYSKEMDLPDRQWQWDLQNHRSTID